MSPSFPISFLAISRNALRSSLQATESQRLHSLPGAPFVFPICYFSFRTYLPSEISRVVALWRVQLGKVNEKAGQSLADPVSSHLLYS